MARLLTVLGLIVVAEFMALVFYFAYPHRKLLYLDEVYLDKALAEASILADELKNRPKDDNLALFQISNEVKKISNDVYKDVHINRNFFKELSQKEKREFDELYFPVSKIYQPLFNRLDMILDDGLVIWINVFPRINESTPDWDSLCSASGTIRGLYHPLMLAAIVEVQNGNLKQAELIYDRLFSMVEGLLDCPTGCNVMSAVFNLKTLNYALLYSLPKIDENLLIQISERISKLKRPTKILLDSLKLDAVAESNYDEVEFIKWLKDGFCYKDDYLQLPNYCILPDRLLIYLTRYWHLVRLYQLLYEIDHYHTWIKDGMPNKPPQKSQQMYCSIFFHPDPFGQSNLFEQARDLELTLPAVIQAIELEIKRRGQDPKPVIELPVYGEHKIIINEDHGCFEPPL